MIVQPAASAGASFNMMVKRGTFHGTIAAATPTGSCRTSAEPMKDGRLSSKAKLRASFA